MLPSLPSLAASYRRHAEQIKRFPSTFPPFETTALASRFVEAFGQKLSPLPIALGGGGENRGPLEVVVVSTKSPSVRVFSMRRIVRIPFLEDKSEEAPQPLDCSSYSQTSESCHIRVQRQVIGRF